MTPTTAALRVVRDPAVDIARAEQAVADLLRALGHDPGGVHLQDTPRRVATAFASC